MTGNLDHSRILAARLFDVLLLLASAVSALAEVHYVDVNNTNATPPYTNWTTAATQIQDAVNAAVADDEIVVTNGAYTGVSVNLVRQPLNIRSVNGPQFSFISGGGIRECAHLTNFFGSATLSGFTLRDGYATRGGGAYGGTLNNCILIDNQAVNPNPYSGYAQGGGAYQCTLNNCILNNNSADSAFLANGGSPEGGGAFQCTLNNCTLSGNSAYYGYGGGAARCTLNNCTLEANGYIGADGGAYGSVLNNCTLTRNHWGANYSTLNNCIVWGNAADVDATSSLNHCWTADPLFVAGSLRLQSNSPCINAGVNAFAPAGTDLDGNPRIAGGTVDIGAYEFQTPVSMISYAWLQQFNLPINPGTDTADPDGDGVNNYHEWLAGTNPTNSLSSPAQLTITPSGTNVILSWSTNAVGFALQSTTDLFSPAAWSTNSAAPVVIGGQNVVTNPIIGPQQFYRLSQ